MNNKYPIDAFIVGAEKAGTTSLAYYLAQHTRIHSHFLHAESSINRTIEYSPFIQEGSIEEKQYKYAYFDAFKRLPKSNEIVMAKNVGILYLNNASKKLKEFYPECKIIISLRNPIERAYSSFLYQRYRGEEYLEFGNVINDELQGLQNNVSWHRKYLDKGLYVKQVERMFDLFGPENVHVLLFESFKTNPEIEIGQIFSFLGLDNEPIQIQKVHNSAKSVRSTKLARYMNMNSRIKNVMRVMLTKKMRKKTLNLFRMINSKELKKPEIDLKLYTDLRDFFKTDVANLEKMLNKDLSIWGFGQGENKK